jgi:hypothetical protein
MKLFSTLIATILIAGLIVSGVYLADAFRNPPSPGKMPSVPRNDSTFVFLSDTQSPLWPETLILAENRNQTARSMVLAAIVSEFPGAVFHCGDLVALGFHQSHWEPIDAFTQELSGKGIPFYPVPGNHEYLVFHDAGIRNFEARYPSNLTFGYSVRIGSVAMVLLNSNLGAMNSHMVHMQDAWFGSTMRSLDADTLVRGVIVACHHSPFTNSRIVDPSTDVQDHFVRGFLAGAKGMLFVSGHCHTFEHFREQGKDFLVIGGGGGLQQPLFVGSERLWVDHFPATSEKRMFHYLSGKIHATGIRLSVAMLKEDFSGFEEAYSIDIPWQKMAAR